jgi:hypothetical protein
MHDFTGFEPVENTVEDISRLMQEVGLYEVIAEDATELSDSDGQQFSNEDFEEMAKELSQEEEEKERDVYENK